MFLSDTSTGGNHGIEITSPIGERVAPVDGFMPLVVRLTNPSANARQWRVVCEVNVQEYSYSFGTNPTAVSRIETSLTAAPGQISTHEILVPLSGQPFDSWSINVVAGSGGLQFSQWQSRSSPGDRGISLVGQQVSRMNFDDLVTEANARDSDWNFGARLDSAGMPRDWRALTGWQGILLSEPEWDGLAPEQRQAVLQWVRFGGRLLLFTEASDLVPVLQRISGRPAGAITQVDGATAAKIGHSLGEIQLLKWDGDKIDTGAVVSAFADTPSSNLSQLVLPSTVDNAKTVATLGSGNLIFGFLLVTYCLVMGPVNLYVLAPGSRRHRLFFTTPLIAISAAALMFGIGLLRDGIGLQGARSVWVELRPDESMAYLHQTQLYRSGMVAGTGFKEQMPLVIHSLNKSRFDSDQRIGWQNGNWSGTFFGSRKREGHRLNATSSTRERLEWRQPSADQTSTTVNSTLAWPVDELLVHGEDGDWWLAKGTLAPGAQVELDRITRKEALTRLNQMTPDSPIQGSPASNQLKEEPGRFFALTKTEGAAAAIPTLESAKWTSTAVLATGPMVTRGSMPTTGETQAADEEDQP